MSDKPELASLFETVVTVNNRDVVKFFIPALRNLDYFLCNPSEFNPSYSEIKEAIQERAIVMRVIQCFYDQRNTKGSTTQHLKFRRANNC